MKRTILIISVITLFSLNCNAQKGANDFGLKVGPNFGWAGSATTAGKSNGAQLGLCVGGFVDHYFTDHVALSVGVNLNLTRLKYQFTDLRNVENFLEPCNVTVDRKFKGSYIEVPVKVKAKFPIVDSWNAFAEAGGGVGVNLSAQAKDSYSFYGVTFEDDHFNNRSTQYRLLQASLHFGLGAEYELSSRMNLFAQLSFRHSLSNMFTHELYKNTNSNLKANYIGLEVGVIF